MALIYCDSFDHYTTNADFIQKEWTVANNDVQVQGGRNGNAVFFGAGDRHVQRNLGTNAATLIAGTAYQFSNPPGTTTRILSFLDTSASLQCELSLTTTRQLRITRNGTQIGTDGPTVLNEDTWYYIEFKVTFHNSTGVAVVRINGVEEFNLTSQDTQATANAYANWVRIGSALGSGALSWWQDDFYVCDATGGVNDNFLGDCRVECLFPNGNGNSSQFDGSDGNSTDNYLLVDETPDDGDTTYVQSPDIGDKDTYAYGNLTTTSGTVFGVQPVPIARKTDAGSRSFVNVTRLSGTEVDGSAQVLSDSYLYFPEVFQTKPGGGSWSISDVNSAEFGVKVNA